jgi:hypothetical protein
MQNGELIPPSSWPSPPGEGGPHGLRGMRNGRNDEKRTRSDQLNRIKSDQIKPNPTKKKRSGPDQGVGRWIKTVAEETRSRSSALDAGKC